MTDISESGLEAAIKAHNTRQDPTLYGMTVQDYGLQQHAREVVQMTAAIQAYLPFHPPASREEGLNEDDWQALLSAVENLRGGGNRDEPTATDTRWRIASNLADIAERLRAALQSKKPE